MKDKTIHRIVRRVVNEALGVNSYVEKAVDGIINRIYELESNGQLEEKYFNRDIKIVAKRGKFNYNLIKDKMIIVEFRTYDFQRDEDLEYFKENYPVIFNEKMDSGLTYSSKENDLPIIKISIVRAGGKIQKNSYDILQHELDHALKDSLTNKNMNKRNYYKYKMATYMISDNDSNENKYAKVAAWIVYYSFPHEQDVFANGFYSELIHSNPTKENLDKLIYNSRYYSVITWLRRVLPYFKTIKSEEIELVNRILSISFMCDIDKIIKIGENTLAKYIHNLGRIKTLILQRLQQNNN